MTTETRLRRIYNQEEIERALYAVAMAYGNLAQASRELAETGLDIPSRTLSDWTRDKHRQRYQEIKLEAIPKIYARLADEMESLVAYQLDVERKLTKNRGRDRRAPPARSDCTLFQGPGTRMRGCRRDGWRSRRRLHRRSRRRVAAKRCPYRLNVLTRHRLLPQPGGHPRSR